MDSPHLTESVYPVCESVNEGQPDLATHRCQTRMCQTCCSMSNAVFNIDIPNEDVFECLEQCEDRYMMTPMTNKK